MIKLRIFNTQIPQELKPVELSTDKSKKNDFLVGRSPSCDILLDNGTISREHGKISFEENQYHFLDLGSTNGSQINNNLALTPFRPFRLSVNDTIQLGDFAILIEEITFDDQLVKTLEEDPTEPSVLPFDESVSIEPSLEEQHIEFVEEQSSPSKYMPLANLELPQIECWTKGSITLECVQIIDETADVKTFCFVANPPKLFTYKPGQFLTLELEINGVELSCSYSILSSPSRPHSLEITVKRVSSSNPNDCTIAEGLESNWLHYNMGVGSRLRASGIFGDFSCFDHPSQKLLFLSASSGLTPMISMSRWIYDTHADCDVVFFHCARSPQDIIYRQELELMAVRSPKFHLAVTITRPVAQESWLGMRGRLTPAMLEMIAPDWCDRNIFVCGPESFMQSTKAMLESLGLPMQQYHEESFDSEKRSLKSGKDDLWANKSSPASEVKTWLGLQLPH
jgi:ferredoxin-NADP reductase/pSer/pThr/pTyr-binding forkhead associated (FHA) protein